MRSRSARTLRFVVRHLQRWPVSLALAAAGVGSLVFAFAITAHADPTPVTYYACVNLSTGSIQMTTATGTCKKGSTLISWNQVGPQGPAGAQGPTEPAGKGGFIASLRGADLNNLDLRYHDLAGVDLSGVDLSGAILLGADLSGANLTNANLIGANLQSADLTNANLTGANVLGVLWGSTTCPDGTNSDSNSGTCLGHGGGL